LLEREITFRGFQAVRSVFNTFLISDTAYTVPPRLIRNLESNDADEIIVTSPGFRVALLSSVFLFFVAAHFSRVYEVTLQFVHAFLQRDSLARLSSTSGLPR